MVGRIFIFLLTALPLFSLECGDSEITQNGRAVSFFDRGTLAKEVSFSFDVNHISCLSNEVAAISVPGFLYLATPSGELLNKKILGRNYRYMYSSGNSVFFHDSDKIIKYTVNSEGKCTISHIFSDTDTPLLFLSKNDGGKEVLFYENRYRVGGTDHPVVIFGSENGRLYYFNRTEKNIFFADSEHFRQPVTGIRLHALDNEPSFLHAFSGLDERRKRDIIARFNDDGIRSKLLFTYMKTTAKNDASKAYIARLAEDEGIEKYYGMLKRSGFVTIDNFGTYGTGDLDTLAAKLDTYTKSFDFRIFSSAGKFTYRLDYPESVDSSEVRLDYFLDENRIFTIKIPAECRITESRDEKGKRYKGFLTMTTVEYVSMFRIEEYLCSLSPGEKRAVLDILQILRGKSKHFQTPRLKNEWSFSRRELLYDISSRQTAFGKAMSDALSSGSPRCGDVSRECKSNCRIKNDENGFFIFSSSDRDKCESLCVDAGVYCNRGETLKASRAVCRAKCVGYNIGNGGIFSRSDYQKCLDRCMD